MIAVETITNGKAEPPRTGEECLREELKDLGAFFKPKLEGVEAKCETTRRSTSPKTITYRMNCRGPAFVMVGETRVTIEDSRRFTLNMQLQTRTMTKSVKMVSVGEALRTGACRK